MTKKQLVPVKNYDVGYGKPPKETQFVTGQSGNPNGRPKGAKTKRPKAYEEKLKNIIYEEAYREITVQDSNGPISIPMAQAVARSLSVSAAKGNQRSQKLFLEMLSTVENGDFALHCENLEVWLNYKQNWAAELERRESLGITGKDPLPHPDHVNIDWKTGEVIVWGPATSEEKKTFDVLIKLEKNINKLRDELAETKGKKRQKEISEKIAILEDALAKILIDWRS
jgi:hypothetical protein